MHSYFDHSARKSYSTDLKLAVQLNIIPDYILKSIPKSSLHRFKNTDYSNIFGLEYSQIFQELDLIKNLAKSKTAKNLFKSALYIKTIILNITRPLINLKKYIKNIPLKQKIVATILKVKDIIGFERALRYFNISKSKFYSWQNQIKAKCVDSVIHKCPKIWPNQLTKKEVHIITKMLNNNKYRGWPVISIAWLAVRKGILFTSPRTWYKYKKILGISRIKSNSRHKKRNIGIRALNPDQIWHADITIFKTLDNVKAYIYFIIDNYSRYILAWNVALNYSANIVFENLKKTYYSTIQIYKNNQKPIPQIDLIVDAGSENNNNIIENFLILPEITIKKIIAQRDIVFSNSIVEAVNKIVKYRHLYLHDIPDFESLKKHLHSFIPIYNNKRPHCSLNGLTPLEAYNGKILDKNKMKLQFEQAKRNRIIYNQKANCPICPF